MQRAITLHALLIVWAAAALVRADDDHKLVPSITVVGSGEVQVQPDMANVVVGVTTEAKTASEALKENNQRMAQLLETLRGLNIPDKHVQTAGFSVTPQQTFDRDRRQPPKIVGYMVTNQVTVKVLELDRLGTLLDAVVQAGSNRVQGVSFSLAEPKPHMDQARRKAITDARERAELYAGEAKVKLGRPLLIQEQSASVPRPMFMAGAELRAAPASEVPIARGEQTLSANVTVTYAIAE
jgi:uncharacterized protein